MIAPGTVCLCVKNIDYAWLNGRCAQVIGYHDVDADGALWHVIAASWLPEVFGDGVQVTTREQNLMPISSPGITTARRTALVKG